MKILSRVSMGELDFLGIFFLHALNWTKVSSRVSAETGTT